MVKSRFAAILVMAVLTACRGTSSSQRPQTADTGAVGCNEATVQIAVGDGFFRHVCGCNATATNEPLQTISCTGGPGLTVVFLFIGQGTHQLIPTTGSSFAASQRVDALSSTRTHSVQFNTAGVYGFTDAFFTQLMGTITVVP